MASAQPLAIPPFQGEYRVWDWSYLGPNEARVDRGRQLFAHVPNGVVMAVGTERFNAAMIMAGNASHGIALDTDEHVIDFHRTNYFLLSVSQRNRLRYLHLRLRATYEEWLEAAAASKPNNPYLADCTFENFLFWQRHVRDEPNFLVMDRDFTNIRRVENVYSGTAQYVINEFCGTDYCRAEAPDRLQALLPQLSRRERVALLVLAELPYEQRQEYPHYVEAVLSGATISPNDKWSGPANYLLHDAAFFRLFDLIESRSLTVAAGNIFDATRLQEIIAAIQARGLQLAAIDASNIWDNNYKVTGEQWLALMNQIDPISTPDTMLIFTSNKEPRMAAYRAFRFQRLAPTPELRQNLAQVIPKQDYTAHFLHGTPMLPDGTFGPNGFASYAPPELIAAVRSLTNLDSPSFTFGAGGLDFDLSYQQPDCQKRAEAK